MADIESLLDERGQTHGSFSHSAATVQLIKQRMRSEDGWRDLLAAQKEALEMIAHKIGRILHGNPHEPDHWRDIAGYATLAAREVEALNQNEQD